jgi:hypothetical protein
MNKRNEYPAVRKQLLPLRLTKIEEASSEWLLHEAASYYIKKYFV